VRYTKRIYHDSLFSESAIGAAIGVGVGWLGESVLRSALPDSQPSDLSTFLIPVGLILAIALLASYIAARRATRIDPVAALRIE
jgi:ABC-type antimicrobial peptide transport system permease subunit